MPANDVLFTDIPLSIWKLICNPVYVVTCLGSCMELMIVSGFVVFLPKYLETQYSVGKSQANIFTGKTFVIMVASWWHLVQAVSLYCS